MTPYLIYLVFVVSYFLHLTSRLPSLGAIRFDFILIVVLLFFGLISLTDTVIRFKNSDAAKKILVFIVFFLLTIPLVKWPGSVIKYGTEWYSKVLVFYLFTLAFVTTEKRLKFFLLIFLGCQFFRGLEPAWLHYTVGYWGSVANSHVGNTMHSLNRLSGAPHDIVNPNQLAWVINNTVPFLFFLGWWKRPYLLKVATSILFSGLLYTLMLTGSRSGLICLLVVFIGIVFFSEKRWKNFLILCFVVVPVAILIAGVLSPDMAERYRSIVDSSAVGGDTAQGRVNGLINNLSTIINFHGLLGHGLGTSSEVNANYLGSPQISHNLYLETLQEVGIVGFVLFYRYIFAIFKELMSSIKKMSYENQKEFLPRVILSLLVWQFMQVIYDLSCFGLSSWEWYLYGGMATVTTRLAMQQRSAMEASEGSLSH